MPRALRFGMSTSDPSASPQATVVEEFPSEAMVSDVTGAETAGRRMTASLLQGELLAFADRYLEAIAEATDWGADHTDDAKARAAFRQTKIVYVTAVVTTVTEPDPLRVLRDLLVMLRLERLVWDDAEISWSGPESDSRMRQALGRLEAQLVGLAQRVFSDEEIDLVHELTAQWHAANPERRYVAFVRFNDLGNSETRRRFEEHVSRGGLLAPVADASRELHEVRMVAERAIFLANHMPMLSEWQAEGFIYHALRLPETQQLLDGIDRFVVTAEGIGTQLETLPEKISLEREAALENLAGLLHKQLTETLEGLARTIRAERESAFQAIDASAGQLLPLAEQFAAAATGMRETMTLVTAMQGDTTGESSEWTPAEAEKVVERLVFLTSQTSALVQSVQELLNTETSDGGLARIDELLKAHETRLFIHAALLVAVIGVVICIALVVWRRTQPVGARER